MTKTSIAKARALRWRRYGRVGSLTYSNQALQDIAADEFFSDDLREEAVRLREYLNAFTQAYQVALKGH